MDSAIIISSLFGLLTDLRLLGLMLAAIPIGMLFGAIPGLGGKLGIVLLIPFVFGLDATGGAVFLLSMHAVVHTGGSIPSILLGVPGTGADAATVVDGFPMARQGEAGRALGASLTASAFGGIVGAFTLALLIPVVRPIVLAFGPPELFFMALLGITFIASVSGSSLAKGLIVGCLGLMLSFVGVDPANGVERFTGGQLFLWEGFDLVTVILGMMAVPEMIALARSDGVLSDVPREAARYRLADIGRGARVVFIHRWLSVRTAIIGAVIGIIPGLGGDVASWICYGHAVQSSRTPERFGRGTVEGVIAPETANNSKEGGALLPTLFFGIPGSSGMAVMLGALVMLGIQPGPRMAVDGLGMVWTLIWTLVIANVLAVVLFLAIGRWLCAVMFVPAAFLVPFILLFAVVGSYLSSGHWQSIPLLLVLGTLGYGFKLSDWPRAPFVIGIILGGVMELSLRQSMTIWGPSFMLRPISLVLLALIIASVLYSFVRPRFAHEVVRDA
jgi:TctA family transporter